MFYGWHMCPCRASSPEIRAERARELTGRLYLPTKLCSYLSGGVVSGQAKVGGLEGGVVAGVEEQKVVGLDVSVNDVLRVALCHLADFGNQMYDSADRRESNV
eukprot:6810461-Pyramimonas_sp.AAC.1